jgi:hypothetical protein
MAFDRVLSANDRNCTASSASTASHEGLSEHALCPGIGEEGQPHSAVSAGIGGVLGSSIESDAWCQTRNCFEIEKLVRCRQNFQPREIRTEKRLGTAGVKKCEYTVCGGFGCSSE